MAGKVEPGYLTYRVVNRLTGAEVIHDLPHPHKSRWNVRAMQQGAPGSVAVGDFTLPLFAPATGRYAGNKALYDQLDYGLRVEAYPGPVAGTPKFAGIITGITKSRLKYELSGKSDIWLAQTSKTFQEEALIGYQLTGNALKYYLGTNVLTWGDDFSAYNAANYASVGTWTATTDDGLPVVSVNAGTNSYLVANAVVANNQGGEVTIVEASGRVNSNSTDTANAGQVGLCMLDGAALNGWAAVLVLKYVSAGTYNVDVQYRQLSAGVWSTLATATNVLTGIQLPWRLQIQFHYDNNGSHIIVNGKDSGLNPTTSLAPIHWPSTAGLFYSQPAAGTATYYAGQLWIGTRKTVGGSSAGVFAAGSVGAGSYVVPSGVNLGAQSFLDLWSLLATVEGWYWRYTPAALSGAGPLGTVDYGASPGSDLSSSAVFRVGENLVDASIEPNADVFAVAARVGGLPGSDSGGSAYWRNIAAAKKYGVIEDAVPVVGSSDFTTLRRNAQQIVANKTGLNAAKSIRVLRDATTKDKWRELDYVTVHDPLLGLYYYKALVIAYTYEEASPIQDLTLDQFSAEDAEVALRRLQSSSQYVGNTFASRA